MEEQRKVSAELDDKAFEVGQFIYKLGQVQQREFDKMWERVKRRGWLEGFKNDEEAKDWLFDYCFNSFNEKDKDGFKRSFSEMCDAEWK